MPVNNYHLLVAQCKLLPLEEYTHIIVSFSGGKDSLALALLVAEEVERFPSLRSKVELWHQCVDGEPGGEGLMDWPCTEDYCREVARYLGFPIRYQWKHGGFEGEMLRENARTKGVSYEDKDFKVQELPQTSRGKVSTRRLFPQTTADLSVRWCSSYLKIDVASRALNNDPRFKRAKVLMLTGERRQESTARSKYMETETHRCSTASRQVDQWRAVIDWPEEDVWRIIEKFRIQPHPAYRLGFGRVSCMTCIFADRDQWASIRWLSEERVTRIALYEQAFGKTIKQGESVIQQADKGTNFVDDTPQWLIDLALSRDYPDNQVVVPQGETWSIPSGAFKRCGGPI